MPHDLKKSVMDAISACQKIIKITAEQTLAEYNADEIRRLAIERLFGILGEAFNRINSVDPSFRMQFPEFVRVVGARNRIIHGYDTVDDTVVWSAAKDRVPELLDKLQAWLENQ